MKLEFMLQNMLYNKKSHQSMMALVTIYFNLK
jgi:hypothetical protein